MRSLTAPVTARATGKGSARADSVLTPRLPHCAASFPACRPEHGDAGGDYDLNRYVGGGWASPHSTSASEGDPAVFNDDEALESGED